MMLNISFRWVWISYQTNHDDISVLACPTGLMRNSFNHAPRIWDSFNDRARSSKYLVIQNHVLILHTRHKRILRQRTLPTSKLFISPHHLCLQCLHIGWQEAIQLEFLPLMWRKGRAFIVKGRPEDIWPLRFMWVGVGLFRCWMGLNRSRRSS